MYGEGISWEGTVLDAGLERKIVTKSGSYFSFGDERLGQGRAERDRVPARAPGRHAADPPGHPGEAGARAGRLGAAAAAAGARPTRRPCRGEVEAEAEAASRRASRTRRGPARDGARRRAARPRARRARRRAVARPPAGASSAARLASGRGARPAARADAPPGAAAHRGARPSPRGRSGTAGPVGGRLAARLERRGVAPAERAPRAGDAANGRATWTTALRARRAAALAARGYGDEAIRDDLERHGARRRAVAAALAGLEPESERAGALIERLGPLGEDGASPRRKGFLRRRRGGRPRRPGRLDPGRLASRACAESVSPASSFSRLSSSCRPRPPRPAGSAPRLARQGRPDAALRALRERGEARDDLVTMVGDVGAKAGIQRITYRSGKKTGHLTGRRRGARRTCAATPSRSRSFLGFPHAGSVRYADTWLRFRHTAAAYKPIAENVTFATTINGLKPAGRLTVAPRTKIDGQASSESAARRASRARRWCGRSGLRRREATAGQRRHDAPGGSLTVSYSRWNEPVRVHVPLDFIDSETGKASGTVA